MFKDSQLEVADLDATDLSFFWPRILFCAPDALWGGVAQTFGQIWLAEFFDDAWKASQAFKCPKSSTMRTTTQHCSKCLFGGPKSAKKTNNDIVRREF